VKWVRCRWVLRAIDIAREPRYLGAGAGICDRCGAPRGGTHLGRCPVQVAHHAARRTRKLAQVGGLHLFRVLEVLDDASEARYVGPGLGVCDRCNAARGCSHEWSCPVSVAGRGLAQLADLGFAPPAPPPRFVLRTTVAA
jgi:hypothetical protein